MAFSAAFRILGWLFTIGGIVYLAFGLRGAVTGTPVGGSFLLLGVVAVVVGTALIRWARRNLQP
jgi:hypothetical protein